MIWTNFYLVQRYFLWINQILFNSNESFFWIKESLSNNFFFFLFNQIFFLSVKSQCNINCTIRKGQIRAFIYMAVKFKPKSHIYALICSIQRKFRGWRNFSECTPCIAFNEISKFSISSVEQDPLCTATATFLNNQRLRADATINYVNLLLRKTGLFYAHRIECEVNV